MKKLLIFSALLFLIKVLALPFVHEIDADGVSRAYLSLQFAEDPSIIGTGNWPPFFFYLMGSALKVHPDQFVTPVLVNIILSVLLLFPLFGILKKHFGDEISFLLCVFFSFSPIVFRMSMLAMSEIPYLFFVILSVRILAEGVARCKFSLFFIAGLLMTIAGGIRYESWILGVMVLLFIAMYRSRKEAIFFGSAFLLFPAYWLLSNHMFSNDALSSFSWAVNLSDEESVLSLDSLLRRLWWFPLSLMFSFGPVAFFFFLKELKYYRRDRATRIVFSIFVTFFIIWICNALRGSLLLQHRFSITLFLFSFPFLGLYFKKDRKRLVLKTLIFSLSAFLFAFAYSSKGARPIPRLLTEDAGSVSAIINENLDFDSGLVCDFWNWETTYYLPFATGLERNKIKLVDTDESPESLKAQVATLTDQYDHGVILLNKSKALYLSMAEQNGAYVYELKNGALDLKPIFENDEIVCFVYNSIQNDTEM